MIEDKLNILVMYKFYIEDHFGQELKELNEKAKEFLLEEVLPKKVREDAEKEGARYEVVFSCDILKRTD